MSEEADYEIDFYGDAGNEEQAQTNQNHGNGGAQQQDGGRDDQGNDEMNDADQEQKQYENDTPQQGTKRKSEEIDDGRPVDPGATAAIMISELSWWTTDDDIRGWLRQAGCEDEAKELTFSEHKVNGKSKGQDLNTCGDYKTIYTNAQATDKHTLNSAHPKTPRQPNGK